MLFKKILSLLLLLSIFYLGIAQKKSLDHTVYDSWQSIGKIQLSNDGNWVVYNINVQEGDDQLVIQATDNSYKKIIPRAYDAMITGDSKSVFFKIKPHFKDIRQAKIKKKKPDEFPKDSFGFVIFGKEEVEKQPNLISFQTPFDKNEWVAATYQLIPEKKTPFKYNRDKDSTYNLIDSLKYVIGTLKPGGNKDSASGNNKYHRLTLANSITGKQVFFENVTDYLFNKTGTFLLMKQTLNPADSAGSARIVLFDLKEKKADTVIKGGNDFRNFTLSEDGKQIAFAAERNAKKGATQKQYELWYFKQGMDSAVKIMNDEKNKYPKGFTISENGRMSFSKSGQRLMFGIAPIKPPKDTTIAEIDKVNVDVWNYKDDYLQPYQLENQKRDKDKSYLSVFDFTKNSFTQLATSGLPDVYNAPEGDGLYFVAVTDTGRRVSSQWTGRTIKDVYKIDAETGKRITVIKNLDGEIRMNWASPSAKYIVWYDNKTKEYFSFDGEKTQSISRGIKVPLFDEENDVPASPSPYGLMGWEKNDVAVFIYDRYDIWRVDPKGIAAPINITKNGRSRKITYRYIPTNTEEKYIVPENKNLLKTFDNTSKKSGLTILENNEINNHFFNETAFTNQPFFYDNETKSKNADVLAYTKENYGSSPNLYVYKNGKEIMLSEINPQQEDYNWGTASLYHWKTFSGKPATGILYKPENFDTSKKYPVIFYFYEKLSDGLYRYNPPSPTPSRLNISFFVSRGYIVMAPDITYTIGHPAKSAYDYIVSGAKDLTKHKWVDSKHLGIQGQSWGGIQVAQLITMTDMFAAAWAGAPVANMTSAYGGIRWKGGINRQFQYEKTQSRIGSTLWQKPELYIENSPLFHLPKVNTPLVIMANDNDGAVPWYQGIELFTGLRRLEKKVWMLNYNGEEHNLVQRKNRKDIQIREQQYFDWLLKGAKPAKWLTEGIKAIDKGTDMGLETGE